MNNGTLLIGDLLAFSEPAVFDVRRRQLCYFHTLRLDTYSSGVSFPCGSTVDMSYCVAFPLGVPNHSIIITIINISSIIIAVG